MTNKEAIKWIEDLIETMKEETSGIYPDPEYSDEVYEALDIAIQALEQETILDKIRAEIIELRSRQNVGVLECLDIIDKYKSEKEE